MALEGLVELASQRKDLSIAKDALIAIKDVGGKRDRKRKILDSATSETRAADLPGSCLGHAVSVALTEQRRSNGANPHHLDQG
jgi:hypothetical protein